jgi:hypothetical protein
MTMKRVLVFTLTLTLLGPAVALAQQPGQPSLADVAKAEEARRKTAKKATKVLTNSNLGDAGTPSTPAPASTTTPPAGSAGAAPGDDDDDRPAAAAGPKRDQKYWQERIATARDDLRKAQMFAEALQTRLNSLANDIFNLDYPARGVAEKQRDAALAELDRQKKEIEAKTKAIAAIEEEARRANVPVGWLRPPA